MRFNKLVCPTHYKVHVGEGKGFPSFLLGFWRFPLHVFMCSFIQHTLLSTSSRPTLCQELRIQQWMRHTGICPHGVHICADEMVVKLTNVMINYLTTNDVCEDQLWGWNITGGYDWSQGVKKDFFKKMTFKLRFEPWVSHNHKSKLEN